MADFRRCILALAVLVLFIGCLAPASAQTAVFTCSANGAVPPTLRQEGMRELVGDIVLNCTGGTATPVGTNIPQANFTVFLNDITSRILTSPNFSESLLLIDDPAAAQQHPCEAGLSDGSPSTGCVVPGDAGASFKTNGAPNVYQGIQTGPNAVTFLGVPIDAPATNQVRVFRITNIRINANAYPAGSPAYPVTAFVSISGSTSVPINNAQPIVGFIAPGLTAAATGAGAGILQCQSNPAVAVATLSWTENFATAFKTRDANPSDSVAGGQQQPGSIYNSESGLILPTSLIPSSTFPAGDADFGTRLKATFSNLPHGITITVPTVVPAGCNDTTPAIAPCMVLIGSSIPSDTTPDPGDFGLASAIGSGVLTIGYTASPCVPTTPSTCNNGTTSAVYEVIADNPFTIESFSVPVSLAYVGTPGTPSGSPEITAITGTNPPSVNLSFAPTPGGLESNIASVIPAFADNTTNTTGLFSVTLCQTILLFPYVTDYPGFDTGIAISNTSMDPLPSTWTAAPQSGACTVNFYGGVTASGAFVNTAPNLGTNGEYDTVAANSFGTGQVGPGQTWAFSVSGIDTTLTSSTFQGFVGYAIATCNFQYAHGYSFVSDFGLRNFAAAYLALIIPDTVRAAQPGDCSAFGIACAPLGEQLVH